MNKAALTAHVASVCGISGALARRIVDAIFDAQRGAIPAALRRGEPVSIKGFGTFTPHASGGVSFSVASGAGRNSDASPRSQQRSSPEMSPPSPLAPSEPLWLGGEASSDVQFTAYHPRDITPLRWYALLVYVHLPEVSDQIERDSRVRLGTAAPEYGRGRGRRTSTIKQGAEITVVPELPGCQFNPSRASVTWLKDWHRVEFEMRCEPDLPGYVDNEAVNGKVSFFVGPVLVGEAKIWAHMTSSETAPETAEPRQAVPAQPFRRIFVSYSHHDAKVVNALEAAYKVLGDLYLRDVRNLRAGEVWDQALLRMIEQADVFQLCWSTAARRSEYVKREWTYALTLNRSAPFIRATYWEIPMPEPPQELQELYFAQLEL